MALRVIKEVNPISSPKVVISSVKSALCNFKELPVILQRISFNEKLIHLSLDFSGADMHI